MLHFVEWTWKSWIFWWLVWNAKMSFLRYFWTEFKAIHCCWWSVSYVHRIKYQLFIHKNGDFFCHGFKKPSPKKSLDGRCLFYGFLLVDQFDEFYRWQFFAFFCFSRDNCLPSLFPILLCFVGLKIPFFFRCLWGQKKISIKLLRKNIDDG